MLTTTDKAPIVVASDDLRRVLDLYEDGFSLQAYHLARTFGPLENWSGTAARIVAGRLAMNLGAPRLAVAHHLRARRDDPTDPEANYYRARAILGRKGPLHAWRLFRSIGDLDDAPDAIRADWFATRAITLGHLRDFDAADAWLDRAEEARPEWPWVQVERATLLGMEDRYEAALEAGRHALDLRPWYRPAVQSVAHTLQLLHRDREALDLLVEAADRLENGPVVAQLASLQSELDHHEDARRSLDRFAELSPMMEKDARRWLAARRSDTCYDCGDHAKALEFARESNEPFFLKLADRLANPDADARRVTLDVPFVRQHHQTCAPATLAALARYWGQAAEHLEVAEAICYDGTPDHRERSWAESNGYLAREFRVTWEAAAALLDRGVPFTLTTIEPMSGHLQAVTGYDARRGTLLIRDPTMPHSGEAFGDGFLEHHRPNGPRGMVMVPLDRADLLEGLDLPEVTLYDHLFAMQCALREHDRARAALSYEAMRLEGSDARLTLQGRRLLASYDADMSELLVAVDRLLALYPDDANLLLGKLATLRDLARRDERVALLKDLRDRPGSDPLFARQYAQELMADAREHPTVLKLVEKVLRARPLDDASIYLKGNVAWDRGEFAEAFELYRIAACLDDKDEGLARAYFLAARHLGRTEETLRFLEARARRFGSKSSRPHRTLYWALSLFERMPEAFEVLDEALRLRPVDGELLLFVADAHGQHGQFDRADERLAQADGHSRREAWLRTAASLATARGRSREALELWRKVLDSEPSAVDANGAVARFLAETEGRPEALEHLRQTSERFPHNFALRQLWSGWLKDDGPAAAEPVVREILAIHPADAWAHRELAILLSQQGRVDEALASMEVASHLEPSSTTEASVRGSLLLQAGRTGEAKEAFREAIRRSVDNDFAIARLIDACDAKLERVEALAFIEGQLTRQVTFGDGLAAFAHRASGILDPQELRGTLRRAWEARPDLWHVWMALIRQSIVVGDLDAARDLATRAIERFPLLPRLRLDLAAVAQARGDAPGEIEALRDALAISPGWSAAARQLASAHERAGDLHSSRHVLDQATARDPLDALNQGWLAEALWKLGEQDEAIDRVIKALRLDPSYEWAWEALRNWSSQKDRPELPAELARELAGRRGGEARSWLTLARALDGPDALEERLGALEKAVALDPRNGEAIDLRVELLAGAGRIDDARDACRWDAWHGPPPLYLRGRAAWVEARAGDYAHAMATMHALVSEDPDYVWGWKNLAEWRCDHAEPPEYLQAAEQMVRLSPDDPTALAYRGEAKLKVGDRAGAKLDLAGAFELAPTYAFAGMTLFDLQREDEELAAAARSLEALQASIGGAYVVARGVQLAVDRSDQGAASEGLRQLCAGPSEGDWPLNAVDEAFVKAGWKKQAEAIYLDALDRPEPLAQVAVLWINRRSARGDHRRHKTLDVLFASGSEAGRRAMVAYLNGLASAHKGDRVLACARKHREGLIQDVICWGSVGYALSSSLRYRRAVRWLQDWENREGLQPWMLINLVIALRSLGRDAEANRASLKALTVAEDYTSPYHETWLALDDALAGQTEPAAERLAKLDPTRFDVTNKFLVALGKALVEVQQAGPSERKAAFKKARAAIASASAQYPIPIDDHAAILHAYRRAVRRMGKDVGGIIARAWAAFRLAEPLVKKVP